MKLATKQRLDQVLGDASFTLVKPLAIVLGWMLRRDHSDAPRGPIYVVKMLGGGSLVVALPALLAVRRRFPDLPLRLVTTPALVPFAETLGIFDQILPIRDRSLWTLLTSGLAVLGRIQDADTVVDLEAHSRLSTLLSLFSRARNRFTFYLESAFWRRNIATHLFFFHRGSGSFHFYGAMARCLGAEPLSLEECGTHLQRTIGLPPGAANPAGALRIGVAASCSELGGERMLRPSQWLRVFAQLIPETAQTLEVVLLGGPGDRATADRIQKACESALPHVKWFNACDGRSLVDSLRLLASCSTLITVDSALGHYARFIKIPVRSLWGPTDPSTRIHPDFGEQKHTYYHRLPCSPCIHLAGALPCGGNNLCIEAAVALVEGKIPSDEAPGLLPISAQGNSSTAREKHPLVGAGS